jgi:TolA-binding protein
MANVYPTGDAGDSDYQMGDTGETVLQLNAFLRGEISACETYRQAIDKLGKDERDSGPTGLLREIQEDHGRAAQGLRDRIRELGGEAADSSGLWGAWAKLAQGSANLLGNSAALKALKEGEEHGLRDYDGGVDDLDPVSADLIGNQMIPAMERHVRLLDQLIATKDAT